MLRALFVIGIICYGCAKSVKGPFYALLFYLWIAYFRPEFWLWSDFYSQLNLSLLVGITVVGSMIISPNEKLRYGLNPFLITLFVVQSSLSTLLSPHTDYALPYYFDFVKCAIMTLMIASLVKDERRLRLLFAVIVGTVCIEAVKQGWLQLILNPGAQNANDYIAFGDNNFVAVGMAMTLSMMVPLVRTASTRAERLFIQFCAVGVLYRGISTYSRGGFLGYGALGLQYLARSRRNLAGILSVTVVLAIIAPVLPDAFWARMSTINESRVNLDDTSEADASISGRLHFWAVAWEMAKDNPLLGVGHNAYNASYMKYDFSNGRYPGARSVHNAWLGVMAELGFPGLFLFVALIGRTFWTNIRVQRLARKHPELSTLAHFAVGTEGALVAFAVGGSFVIFQYHEILWHLIGVSIAIDAMARERLAKLATPVPVAESVRSVPWNPGSIVMPPVGLATRKSGIPGA